jgi:tetratricopeptide (TPR) repeat protein
MPPGQPDHALGQLAERDSYLYAGPAHPRPRYRREFGDLLAFHRRRFVGRGRDLDELAAFAAEPGGGYLLVEAPAGYGKSALLAELVGRWQTRRWSSQPTPALVYFFIHAAGDEDTPDAFCAAVSAQLLDVLDLPGGLPPGLDARARQFASLWARASEAALANQPLLLVVDGLDQMGADELTIADLLPAQLGRHAGVIVSSRPSLPPAARVAAGHPLHQARVRRLRRFDRDEVEGLLRAQGGSPRNATAVAARIRALTGGEPLFTQLVCQEVTVAGGLSLAQLETAPPADVRDYADRHLRGLAKRADSELAWDLLALLLVARGPMARADLADVLGVPRARVGRAVDAVRPFLRADEDRLEFAHLELRVAVAEEFTPAERRRYRRRLIRWCARFAHAGWPDDTPAYVLEHYAAHLADVGDVRALYALVSRRWMRLQAARTGSHHALTRDVRRAIRAAGSEHPANLLQDVRGSLIHATVASQAATAPAETLGVLATVAGSARASGYAARFADPARRVAAYREIAAELLRHPEVSGTRLAARRALVSAQAAEAPWAGALLPIPAAAATQGGDEARGALPAPPAAGGAPAAEPWVIHGSPPETDLPAMVLAGSTADARAVAKVARALAQAGRVAEAIGVADAAPDPARGWALAEVAGALAGAGRVAEARAIARRTRRAGAEVLALTDVAAALVKAGRVAEAVATLDQTMAAVRTLEGPLRAWMLARVARIHVMAGQADHARVAVDEALTIARAFQDVGAKAEVAARAGEALVAAGQAAEAVKVAAELPEPWRAWALAEVADALVAAGHVAEAVEVARRLTAQGPGAGDRGGQPVTGAAEILDRVPRFLPPDEREPGERRGSLEGGEARARALAAIAAALAVAGRSEEAAAMAEDALAGAGALAQAHARAGALAEVAAALAVAGRPERAAAMAERAQADARAVRDPETGARAFGEVAAGLARAGRVGEALAIVRRLEGGAAEPRALAQVTDALVAAGKVDEAAATAERALDRVGALGESHAGAVWLGEVASALAAVGRTGEAGAVAEKALERMHGRGESTLGAGALAEIAAGLARAGRLTEAMEVAQRVEAGAARAGALAAVAAALAVAGRADEAATVVGQALACARTTSRSAVFQVVRHGLPLFGGTGDGDTVAVLGHTLVEVERWWDAS